MARGDQRREAVEKHVIKSLCCTCKTGWQQRNWSTLFMWLAYQWLWSQLVDKLVNMMLLVQVSDRKQTSHEFFVFVCLFITQAAAFRGKATFTESVVWGNMNVSSNWPSSQLCLSYFLFYFQSQTGGPIVRGENPPRRVPCTSILKKS